jgi:hypothetical protein
VENHGLEPVPVENQRKENLGLVRNPPLGVKLLSWNDENQPMENLGLVRNPSVDPMPVPVGFKLRVLSWNNRKKRGLLGCGT